MGGIINLAERREERKPHLQGPAICLACLYEWQAVAVLNGTIWLDCPACTLERGRFRGPVLFNGDHWHCNCGNELFHITATQIYCPNCGAEQRIP